MDGRSSSNLTPPASQVEPLRSVTLTLILCVLWFVERPVVRADNLSESRQRSNDAIATSLDSIRLDDLKRHVNTLASDTLQGREAGGVGGHAASAYLMTELRRFGLEPAGVEGQYPQEFQNGMRNLLAVSLGSDPALRQEIVLVCAHFDHVGYGTPRNSRGPVGFIHNGADDNASGTSALLEVIEAWKLLPRNPKRTVLFAFWDGEEKGLLGSKHWIANPTRPLQQIKLVLNSDMIGRLRDEGVEITGSRTARGLRSFLSEANSAPNGPRLLLDFTWEIRADSDHHPFFAAGIPSLMLHTGKHDDYHRPSDDADKLNYEGLQQLARMMLLLAWRAADAEELPGFRPQSREETKEQQRLVEQPASLPPSRLGITWNSPLSEQRVVEITEVAPRSPAALAGLLVGDRVTHFAGHSVAEVADFRSLVTIADREVSATVQRPGRSEPLSLLLRLAGEPTRLGIAWRSDDAEPNCVVLTRVLPHSPAALAGLRPFDQVRSINDQAAEPTTFQRLATTLPLPITLTFERQGRISQAVLSPVVESVATKRASIPMLNAR